MKRSIWISLGIYFFLLLLLSSYSLRIFLLSAMTISIAVLLLILYRIIESEIFFYAYNFTGITALLISLKNYNPYSWVTLGVAYSVLSILLIHLYLYRFFQKFGTIKRETLAYLLLATLLSFFSVQIFMMGSIGYGFWGAVGLGVAILILLYFLIQPKSKESSDST